LSDDHSKWGRFNAAPGIQVRHIFTANKARAPLATYCRHSPFAEGWTVLYTYRCLNPVIIVLSRCRWREVTFSLAQRAAAERWLVIIRRSRTNCIAEAYPIEYRPARAPADCDVISHVTTRAASMRYDGVSADSCRRHESSTLLSGHLTQWWRHLHHSIPCIPNHGEFSTSGNFGVSGRIGTTISRHKLVFKSSNRFS